MMIVSRRRGKLTTGNAALCQGYPQSAIGTGHVAPAAYPDYERYGGA